jgi:hypothetical protein
LWWFLLLSQPPLMLLPLPLPLLMQLVPQLQLALLLLPPLMLLHPLPATLRSNHFLTREKAASGRLFRVCNFSLALQATMNPPGLCGGLRGLN